MGLRKTTELLIIALVFMCLVLAAGCSTLGLPVNNAWTFNPANYQGCTVITHEVDSSAVVTWHDCKDKTQLAATVDLNSDGITDLSYTATDVIGSDAAAIRAEVEKIFSDNAAEVAPEIKDTILNLLMGL